MTALFAALVLTPTCTERLKIPNECPDISSTKHGSIVEGEGGDNNGGTVIVTRGLLQGQPSKAQHSAEAMFAAMASFDFVGADLCSTRRADLMLECTLKVRYRS